MEEIKIEYEPEGLTIYSPNLSKEDIKVRIGKGNNGLWYVVSDKNPLFCVVKATRRQAIDEAVRAVAFYNKYL